MGAVPSMPSEYDIPPCAVPESQSGVAGNARAAKSSSQVGGGVVLAVAALGRGREGLSIRGSPYAEAV